MNDTQARDRGLRMEFVMHDRVKTMLDHCCIHVDPSKFAHAIRNVISNALNFTPSGGLITVGVYPYSGSQSAGQRSSLMRSIDASVARLRGSITPRSFDWLCVVVTDTGVGISKVGNSTLTYCD